MRIKCDGVGQVCWRGSGVLATIFSAGKVRSAALVRCAGDYLFCWQELGVLLWVRCAGKYFFSAGKGQKCSGSGVAAGRA